MKWSYRFQKNSPILLLVDPLRLELVLLGAKIQETAREEDGFLGAHARALHLQVSSKPFAGRRAESGFRGVYR